MSTKVWISRNKGILNEWVLVSDREPVKYDETRSVVSLLACPPLSRGKEVKILCSTFKSLFGYTPRKGTCVEKELIIK